MENLFKCMAGGCILLISTVFGTPDSWLITLVALVVIDYFTGLAKAYILGKLSSKVGFKGIVKKVMYFAIVAVASMTDTLIGDTGTIRMATIGVLIANESLSILENCAQAGIPVPDVLMKALDKLKHMDNKTGQKGYKTEQNRTEQDKDDQDKNGGK